LTLMIQGQPVNAAPSKRDLYDFCLTGLDIISKRLS
jgi:hypothetical protein